MSDIRRDPAESLARIDHAEAERLISSRFDTPLDPVQNRTLLAHLSTCASCRGVSEQMETMASGLRALPMLPPSPTVSRQVRERIAERPSAWSRIAAGLFNGRWGAMPAAAGALAVVAAIAFVVIWRGDGGNTANAPIAAPKQTSLAATRTTSANVASPTATGRVLSPQPTYTPRSKPAKTATTQALLPNVQVTPPPSTETAAPSATATGTATPSETATTEPTGTPVPSATATTTPSETPKPSATATSEPTETASLTATAKPSETPAPTETSVPTETPTVSPSATDEPTESATIEPTATDKPTRTPKPAKPPKPTETATATATEEPTQPAQPTIAPSGDGVPVIDVPTDEPTDEPPIETPSETPPEPTIDETGSEPANPTTQASIIQSVGGETTTPETPAAADTPATDQATPDVLSPSPLNDATVIAELPAGLGVPPGGIRAAPGQLFFVVEQGGLSVIDANGAIVANLGAVTDPMWSSDGSMLLFATGEGGEPGLAVWNGATTVAIGAPHDRSVVDVPAGWIDGNVAYLRTLGVEAKTLEVHLSDPSGENDSLLWSGTDITPVGRPIATSAGVLIPAGGSWKLIDTGGTESDAGPDPFGGITDPLVSPGGAGIAFVANGQLMAAAASSPGGDVDTIPSSGSAGYAWSPNGELVVSDGSVLAIYNNDGTFIAEAAAPDGTSVAVAGWGDDGIRFVVFGETTTLRVIAAEVLTSAQT